MSAKIVICASGEGTVFQAIAEATRRGELAAEVKGLIVSREGIGALARAAQLQVPATVLNPKNFPSADAWDRALLRQLEAWHADWVVLAGFLSLIGSQVLGRYSGRIVNTHPALLPKHGGQGMFGRRVHQAVLAAGDRKTGVTVHTIDAEYDRGKILAQLEIPVQPNDSPATLEARVKEQEILFYPRVLNDLVTGRITTG